MKRNGGNSGREGEGNVIPLLRVRCSRGSTRDAQRPSVEAGRIQLEGERVPRAEVGAAKGESRSEDQPAQSMNTISQWGPARGCVSALENLQQRQLVGRSRGQDSTCRCWCVRGGSLTVNSPRTRGACTCELAAQVLSHAWSSVLVWRLLSRDPAGSLLAARRYVKDMQCRRVEAELTVQRA
jgi:hypothetical protein